jgi:hypothetical protein
MVEEEVAIQHSGIGEKNTALLKAITLYLICTVAAVLPGSGERT